MEVRTLLIDGSSLFKRSFDGAKDSYTKQGFMGGLYGFLTTTRMLVRDYQRNKVVIAWDGENGGLYRYQIDPAYKANRKSKSWHEKIELTEAEIKREEEKDRSVLYQRQRIKAYGEELFFRQIQIDEIEADDLIAAYCLKNAAKEDIILATNDQDFLQLLTLGIKIRLLTKKILLTAGNFFLYYPYNVNNALILKILCGDSSDNIQGIKGVQEKTLFKYFPDLLTRPMTVREICQQAAKINEERGKDNLNGVKKKKEKPIQALTNIVEGIERLKLNYLLTNLSKPFLNEQAEEELKQLEFPLDEENRGLSNLHKLMNEDDFLSLFSNYGDFTSYVEPFSTVVSREKELYKKFLKK